MKLFNRNLVDGVQRNFFHLQETPKLLFAKSFIPTKVTLVHRNDSIYYLKTISRSFFQSIN